MHQGYICRIQQHPRLMLHQAGKGRPSYFDLQGDLIWSESGNKAIMIPNLHCAGNSNVVRCCFNGLGTDPGTMVKHTCQAYACQHHYHAILYASGGQNRSAAGLITSSVVVHAVPPRPPAISKYMAIIAKDYIPDANMTNLVMVEVCNACHCPHCLRWSILAICVWVETCCCAWLHLLVCAAGHHARGGRGQHGGLADGV